MRVRTLEEIKSSLQAFQMGHHPLLRDYTDYSVLSTLNGSYAHEVIIEEQNIMTETLNISPLTATGSALDALIIDRLPGGRVQGTRAVGYLVFRTTNIVADAVDVPVGTQVIALAQNGDSVWYETTQAGQVAVGTDAVRIAARAVEMGTQGNVAPYAITILPSPPLGIVSVENSLPFTGGTSVESDDELRDRYIYAILLPGKATTQLMEEHLTDLDSVIESHVYTRAPGDIEVIVDDTASPVGETDYDVVQCITDNVAAGVTCRGILGALITNGVPSTGLSDCAGGKIYVRITSNIIAQAVETITITYTDMLVRTRIGTATVYQNMVKGDVVAVTMQDADDSVINITEIAYDGANSFDVLMGLGDYPYLYVLPRTVFVDVDVVVTEAYTAESDLLENIKASVTDFLNDYKIGVDLEYSDLVQFLYMDYGTNRVFNGINRINSCLVTCEDVTISSFESTFNIDEDQRIRARNISVTTA